jgi:hypothetical protein
MPATSGSWYVMVAPIPSMCRITCASFGSFLTSRVRASAHAGDQADAETGGNQPVRQHTVVIAGRLHANDDRPFERQQRSDQVVVVSPGVQDCHTPPTSSSNLLDQNLVTVLGNVDGYERRLRPA